MKVANKLDENYLLLVRGALYNNPESNIKRSNNVESKKSNFKNLSSSDKSAKKHHVDSKNVLVKAKAKIKPPLKKQVGQKQASLIEEYNKNGTINIISGVCKKTDTIKKKKNKIKFHNCFAPVEDVVGPNANVKQSPAKSITSISKKKNKDGKPKTNKNCVRPDISQLDDNYHILSKNLGIHPSTAETKKKKSKPSFSLESTEHSLHTITKNIPKNVDSKKLEKDKLFRKKNKLKKRKREDNDNSNLQTSDNNIEEEKVNDALVDSDEHEDVSIKGLKFERFCSLFVPSHNIHIAQQGVHFNVPRKHFDITLNDVDEDYVNYDVSNKSPLRKSQKEWSKKSKTKQNISMEKELILEEEIQNSNILEESYVGGDSLITQNVQDSFVNAEDDLTDNIETVHTSQYDTIEKDQHFMPKDIIKLTDDNVLIILASGCLTYFHGICSMEVLNGEIEILGSIMKKCSGIKNVYSSRGYSLLYIKNNYNLSTKTTIKLRSLSLDTLPKEYSDNTYKENVAIVLCKDLIEPYMAFIEKHIPQVIFPSEFSGPKIDFTLCGHWNKLIITDKWKELFENVSHSSKIFIAGGKGVGKSTFLRYSVNTLLQKFKQVRVIDLDSGQSEFTPPGVISVITVEDQLLGPNYTHLLKPDCMILSHINIGHNIKKYLLSVKYLLRFLKDLPSLPTLVNYHGFVSGIGLDISLNTIGFLKPNTIIEIVNKNPSKNYKFNLTSDNVNKYIQENNDICGDVLGRLNNLSYDYIKLDSLVKHQVAWAMEARQSREVSILSYLGKMMSEDIKCLHSPDINMYSIHISSLSIKDSEGQDISPLAINANLVVLGSLLDRESAIFSAYGYGIVRGVDIKEDTLVLVTPEPLEVLEKVDHLILGSVTIPPSLLMTVDGIKGLVPYVSVGKPVNLGQFTKRSYLPPLK